jgi:PTH1 family peptidyl-tRNA hydrolase
MVVDRLGKKLSHRFSHRSHYHIAHADNFSLVKPMMYMNNSGIVVAEYLQTVKSSEFFIVVCDDLALPLGKIRIREKGSDGGHNGLASIIYHLQTDNFPRMRIGIGQPSDDLSATEYVLANFLSEEEMILDKTLDISCSALLTIRDSGISTAMNKYNTKSFEIESEVKQK